MTTGCIPPSPQDDWALFLDIDGTLVEIAPKPGAVAVPPQLSALLVAASNRLGGALALVSGRPLDSIDRLLAPLKLPCSAEHGATVRYFDGTVSAPDPARRVPDAWRERVAAAAARWPGVLVENKPVGICVHFRLAPDREGEVRTLLDSLVAESADLEVLPAHKALEIRDRRLTKGEGVLALMKSSPFAGRVPVFVGDDVTDEDGFRAARALGGLGLRVGEVFGGAPANVRQWLKDFAGGT